MAIRNKAFSKVTTLSNKVAEVELSKETVDLGLADDIGKKLGDMKGLLSEMKSLEKDSLAAIKTAKEAEDKRDKVLKANGSKGSKGVAAAEKVQAILDKAEKQANDLGVSPSAIKGYSALEDIAVEAWEVADEVAAISKRGY